MVNRKRGCVAVIGDVVGSRRHPDREALHRRVAAALDAVTVPGMRTRARVTVGDEFQVSLEALPAALGVVWDLRVALLPEVDVRFGVGLGEAAVLDAGTDVEDGTAWWAARRAIEEVKETQRRPAGAYRRVAVRAWEEGLVPAAQVADGGQAGVDALFAALDQRDLDILAALREGLSQAQAGRRVGISQQSVSERVGGHALGALLAVREAWSS